VVSSKGYNKSVDWYVPAIVEISPHTYNLHSLGGHSVFSSSKCSAASHPSGMLARH
jgi:hypothetical protein